MKKVLMMLLASGFVSMSASALGPDTKAPDCRLVLDKLNAKLKEAQTLSSSTGTAVEPDSQVAPAN